MAETTPSPPRERRTGNLASVHIILIAACLAMIAPFVWQFITSTKSLSGATAVPPSLLPGQHWDNYAKVFDLLPFGQQFLNTLLMALLRTMGQVLFCSMAAYAFARLRFPGRNLLFGVFLSVLMVPPQLFVIPQYQIMASLGWLNSLQALVVPGMFSAFGVFLLRQFILGLPKELEEAARLDGAGPVRIYWSIVLPLARSGLVALALLTLVWSWNDLLWPLIVNTDPEKMTLSAGIASLQGQYLTNYPVLMAGALLASLPIIVIFIALQRQFIQGIAHTGIKG